MDSQEESANGIPNYVADAVVAVLILILGSVVIYGSRQLGAGWGSDGPQSGYFPFYIGLILVISAVGVLYQTFVGKRNTELFVDTEQLGRVMQVLIPAAIYVAGIQFIGIYVSSAIYIALFMIILGKFSWIKSVILALAINTLFFFMFEVWFKVPLYKGLFDPLSFTGY